MASRWKSDPAVISGPSTTVFVFNARLHVNILRTHATWLSAWKTHAFWVFGPWLYLYLFLSLILTFYRGATKNLARFDGLTATVVLLQ